MKKAGLAFLALSVALLCAASAHNAHAQTYTTLATFNGPNGADPSSPLLQGLDGNIYGVTNSGGANCDGGCGIVFSMTPSGALTTLHSFCAVGGYPNCFDGSFPYGALLQSTNGTFYGTTTGGGVYNTAGYFDALGTVFEIDSKGNFTSLHSFAGSPGDGNGPSGLITGANGSFYGITASGGDNCVSGPFGCGNAFNMTASGNLATIHNFCVQTNCTDGWRPVSLVLASDGNFYGTTAYGGTNGANCGIAFRMTPSGKLTILHNFGTANGCYTSALTQGNDGNFYGTAASAGTHGTGTIFKMTPTGQVTTLYNFCSQLHCADGASPNSGLVLANDGNFYGTTRGTDGQTGWNFSVIFSISPSGTYTVLHTFNRNTEGTSGAGLMQATDGSFYSTTVASAGGSCDTKSFCGSIFNFSVGLGPFVKTLPNVGKAGRTIAILGNNLTGTSSVTFNGIPATSFTVVSPTSLRVTVPSGATSGLIQVTTPSGTLSTVVPFQVAP